MNLAAVAERMAAIERSQVTLNVQRCLHTTDRFAACQSCRDICPVDAIQAGRPPSLNADICANCLACLPVCPTGAFSADDAVPALLDCAARVEARALELICERHARPAYGLNADSKAIRVRGCLAGLGVGALVALAAMGVQTIELRTDGCAECAWGCLRGLIEQHLGQAQRLLAPFGLAHRLRLLADPALAATLRPVMEADNPPLSRRDLFRLAARRGQVLVARAVKEAGASSGPHAARERQRVVKAMAALPAPAVPAHATDRVGAGYALVHVSEACSACGVCARACPSGAIEWQHGEPDHYRLLFYPQRCTGCEACSHGCLPGAMHFDHQPAVGAIFGAAGPQVLSEGTLVRCKRCNAWTAAAPGKGLCPACDFRRQNPFGTRAAPSTAKVQA